MPIRYLAQPNTTTTTATTTKHAQMTEMCIFNSEAADWLRLRNYLVKHHVSFC